MATTRIDIDADPTDVYAVLADGWTLLGVSTTDRAPRSAIRRLSSSIRWSCSMRCEHLRIGAVHDDHLDTRRQPLEVRPEVETRDR